MFNEWETGGKIKMAKNDVILIDGILEERVANNYPSQNIDEVFEYFAYEQLLKNYDLTKEEILSCSVDGRKDGGIDAIFIFINGHLIDDTSSFNYPRSKAEICIEVISCKHAAEFKQAPIDALIPTVKDFFDFTKDTETIQSIYNQDVISARKKILTIYKKLASSLESFKINFTYASRGDSSIIGEEVLNRKNQLLQITNELLSDCSSSFSFFGSQELLKAFRKKPCFSLDLLTSVSLASDNGYVVLVKLSDYYKFITDEDNNLRKYLFDSNVRDFMGLNPVNEDIKESLENKTDTDFWWLNNGITILTTNCHMIGRNLSMENIQIVNGLQTTQSIYNYMLQNPDSEDDRQILVKIIISDDKEKRDHIIVATNNQTNVTVSALHATDKIQRDIEDILFKSGYYYERRPGFYQNQGIEAYNIITTQYLASGYLCLKYKAPEKAASLKSKFMRIPKQYEVIFNEKDDIRIWPKIVQIMILADKILLSKKGQLKGSSEKYLKTWRYLLSMFAISKILGKYDYSLTDIINLKSDSISEEVFEEMLTALLAIPELNSKKKKTYSRNTIIQVCDYFHEKYNISGIDFIKNSKGIPTSLEYEEIEVSEEFVAKVKSLLPPQPWKVGIHAEIGLKTNSSKQKVRKAIEVLIKRGEVHNQKNGIVFDEDGNILCIDETRVDKDTLKLKSLNYK